MSNQVVLVSYILSFLVAVFALYWFGKAKWYWHALSFAAALAIGLMPPLAVSWSGPGYDILVGSVFIALLVWGAGEPVYDAMHLPHHTAHGRHA